MITEKTDLFEYFGIKRNKESKGILTSYMRDPIGGDPAYIKARPAMLVIPGGGYACVSDREGEPVALEYLNRGYHAFVLDYDVAPDCCYPSQILEAAMAMIYIRKNAASKRIRSPRSAFPPAGIFWAVSARCGTIPRSAKSSGKIARSSVPTLPYILMRSFRRTKRSGTADRL